ncbi:MAG: family 78 glycoside hydrolase catalytic domain, partial [Chitinophagaceae bacterium]|nr:family 78 glycoside hydrolase catalytic domain [Chitinophagaceae bacterium]
MEHRNRNRSSYKSWLHKMKKILLYLLFLLSSLKLTAQVAISNLRCEMRELPAGIDAANPRLGWNLVSELRIVQQTAYQVIVSSDEENLRKNKGDMWNSGKVSSSQSINIIYAGKPLQSGKKYFWKVTSYTNKGTTPWSNEAYWITGLLDKSDWKGKWIGYDKASSWDSITKWSRLSARYLRKSFAGNGGIKRATVFIAGMGLYELYINGQKIGDQVLSPNPTDYRKTVLYNVQDVTKQVKSGENVIATVLGNGRFFTMRQNYKTQKHNTFGYPKLLLQLEIEYANGEKKVVVSDESWKLNVDGPIRTNNEYDGEEYDATKEFPGWNNNDFNDAAWMNAELTDAPTGELRAQSSEPMKVMQSIRPVAINDLGYGKYIIDMGQNFAGWLKIRVKGNRGNKVVLRFAESLQVNEEIFTSNLRDAKVTDVYTLKGEGVETWEPSFVYHGFRYVEVTGFPGKPVLDDFEGKLVYDAIETTGAFTSSNKMLNRIHQNAWWGIASNYKGMPVDCPQRNERQPWLGDRAVGSQGESYLFGNGRLYAKWLDDIEESQREDGAIPDVAPAFWNYYSDNVTWPGTYILVANMLYNQFGDLRSVEKHYPSMRKWILYMKDKYLKDFIMTKDKFADWCVPPESAELIHSKDPARQTDGVLIATAYYHRMLFYMQRFANLLNKKEDADSYQQLMTGVAGAFNKKFYNPAARQYSNNTVTANLLPLYFGIAPDSAKAALFESIRKKIHVDNHDHISTGLIGTQWLMRGLTEYGYADLALALAVNDTYPGWGYMVENDATTIWELWNGNTANPGMNSQNHVMLLGDLLIWYYENLAGIRTDKSSVGFKKTIMKPVLIDGLDTVDASYNSVHGQIKSRIINAADKLQWIITIPGNTSAIVHFPVPIGTMITDSGKPIDKLEGVKFVKQEADAAVYEIGSGSYSFTCQYKWKAGIVKNEFIFTHTSFP